MAGLKCAALLVAVQCALVLSMAGAAPVSEATNAKAAAVPTWSEHDSADFEHACLRATTLQQCQIMALVSGLYFEEGLECCNSDNHYQHDDPSQLVGGFPALTIGKCAWTLNPFLIPLLSLESITDSGTTTQLGTYDLQCDLKEGSEECHEGLCADMVLQSTGPLYWVPNSILKSTPDLIPDGESCEGFDNFLDGLFGFGDDNKLVGGPFESLVRNITQNLAKLVPHKQTPPASKKAKSASAEYHHHEHAPKTYTEGVSVVATGPVSIFSKSTNLKFKEGHMQATPLYIQTGATGEATPGPDNFLVEPYTYKLKLKRGAGYQGTKHAGLSTKEGPNGATDCRLHTLC